MVVNSVPGRDLEASESLSFLDHQLWQCPVSTGTEMPAESKQRHLPDLLPLGSRPLHGRKGRSNWTCDCHVPQPGLSFLTVSSHLILLTRNLRPREGIYPLTRKRRCGFNSLVGKRPWRRTRQPNPVFLRGKFPRQRRLTSYNPWGCRE